MDTGYKNKCAPEAQRLSSDGWFLQRSYLSKTKDISNVFVYL